MHCTGGQFNSSEPSVQSLEPSHRHSERMHSQFLHWNSPDLQVGAGRVDVQFFSSLPSVQSRSPSHCQDVLIHSPEVHLNNSGLQVLFAVRIKK